MSDWEEFDRVLAEMEESIGRAHAVFGDADAAFAAALDALRTMTVARDTLDDRITELRDTLRRLGELLSAQGDDLRAVRERFDEIAE
jgi:ABC-type transporter Mla subunit MlaD